MDVFEIGLARTDVTVVCCGKVKMDVALDTRAQRVLIRDLETYVVNVPIDVLFVGDDVLQKLGVSPQHLLEQKFASRKVKDVASPYPKDSCLNETFTEDDNEVPIGETNNHDLLEVLENMVLRASKGLSEMQGKSLLDLVFEFRNICRLRLSADGSAEVTSLKAHLEPNTVPRRAKARRDAPKHLVFMRKQIKLLEEMCYIRRNPHSQWSSPELIVPKPKLPDEFRMAVDTRHSNSQLVAIAGCLPILEVILQHLKLASVFATLDAFKWYWQFPLDVDYREIYSLLTDVVILTPERTVPGSTDAAHAFQVGMYESIDILIFHCVLIWIDDLLVNSKSFEEHLRNMGKVFERLRKFNIKLNSKKSELFALHIIWCGRKIYKDRVTFDPA